MIKRLPFGLMSDQAATVIRIREKFELAMARSSEWKLGLKTAIDRDQISVFAETPLVNPQGAALLRDPETKAVLLRALRGKWVRPVA